LVPEKELLHGVPDGKLNWTELSRRYNAATLVRDHADTRNGTIKNRGQKFVLAVDK
jgi:hypothetical protein